MTDEQKAKAISFSVVAVLVVGLIISLVIGGPSGGGTFLMFMLLGILIVALFAVIYVGLREFIIDYFDDRRSR